MKLENVRHRFGQGPSAFFGRPNRASRRRTAALTRKWERSR
jgi:hypothetical protein